MEVAAKQALKVGYGDPLNEVTRVGETNGIYGGQSISLCLTIYLLRSYRHAGQARITKVTQQNAYLWLHLTQNGEIVAVH